MVYILANKRNKKKLLITMDANVNNVQIFGKNVAVTENGT